MSVAEMPFEETLVRKERSLWEEAAIRLVKNRVAVGSIIFILVLVLAAVFANLLTPYTYAEQDLLNTHAVPKWMLAIMPAGAENYAKVTDKFVLGADHLGRDIFTRTIYGARVSLGFAFVAAAVSLTVGLIYGMIAGYIGGALDNVLMRVVDFLYAFPFLVVVILMQTYFKALERRGGAGFFFDLNDQMGGMLFLFIAIGLIDWIGVARIARGQVLQQKRMEFVEAANAVGASDARIIRKHLLPNILGPMVVYTSLQIPGYIFLESFLSFIGLGVNQPTPSWGIMISEAVQGLRSYPHAVLVPAIALSLTTLAFNFLGDGLRDALDPRMKE
jgi:oligopeptide transport system permease protein